jgi:predicted RNase H-like nuclease (RuvC/YqgF family)
MEGLEKRIFNLNKTINKNKDEISQLEEDLEILTSSDKSSDQLTQCSRKIRENIRKLQTTTSENEMRLKLLIKQKQRLDEIEADAQQHDSKVADVIRRTMGL